MLSFNCSRVEVIDTFWFIAYTAHLPGADVNVSDADGDTPLHLAVGGRIEGYGKVSLLRSLHLCLSHADLKHVFLSGVATMIYCLLGYFCVCDKRALSYRKLMLYKQFTRLRFASLFTAFRIITSHSQACWVVRGL